MTVTPRYGVNKNKSIESKKPTDLYSKDVESNVLKEKKVNLLHWSKTFEPLEPRIQPTLSVSKGHCLLPSSQYIILGQYNIYLHTLWPAWEMSTGCSCTGYILSTLRKPFFPFEGYCKNEAKMLLASSNGRWSAPPLHHLSPVSRITQCLWRNSFQTGRESGTPKVLRNYSEEELTEHKDREGW